VKKWRARNAWCGQSFVQFLEERDRNVVSDVVEDVIQLGDPRDKLFASGRSI
jgi:hypothetical protein